MTNRQIDGMSIFKAGFFHLRYSREREERPRTQLWGTPTVNVWKKEETLAKDQPVDQKQKADRAMGWRPSKAGTWGRSDGRAGTNAAEGPRMMRTEN